MSAHLGNVLRLDAGEQDDDNCIAGDAISDFTKEEAYYLEIKEFVLDIWEVVTDESEG